MSGRELLDELMTAKRVSYSAASAMLGRNSAYIQQYIKRGTPRTLSRSDEATLASYFRMPENFLRNAASNNDGRSAQILFSQIRDAIAALEELGFTDHGLSSILDTASERMTIYQAQLAR